METIQLLNVYIYKANNKFLNSIVSSFAVIINCKNFFSIYMFIDLFLVSL